MALAKDFTVFVKSEKTAIPWPERYQKETDDPEQFGRDLIEWFNSTCRKGEAKRTFVRVELHGEVRPPEHKWSKTNLVTQSRGGRMFDRMKCERCGITGKRYRLQETVSLDDLYRSKVYRRCDTTVAHLLAKTGLGCVD